GTVQPAQLAVDSVTGAFVGYPIGNQFLNSPHSRFSGTAGGIGSPKAYSSSFANGTTSAYCSDPNFSTLTTCTAASGSWAGTCSNPAYLVLNTCTTNAGTWTAAATANVNAGCLNCHDVHVGAVDPDTMDPASSQSSINSNRHCQSCHVIDLNIISHPTIPGTPLDKIGVTGYDQTKATELACITCHMGPDLNHLVRINTDAAYRTATPGSSAANTYTDNGYTQAVGMDLDHACGQCHSVETGTAQNRFTTGQMSVLADDIHNNIPKTADFSATASATVKKQLDFVATGCSTGGTCSYKWKFGDGQTVTVATAETSHIYPSAGSYIALVTVTEGSAVSMSRAGVVTAISVNIAPTAAKTITQSGWTVGVTDSSTDDDTLPAGAVTVDWGNGTTSTGNAGATISKLYTVAGTYIIKHKVTDAEGKAAWSANTQVTVPIKYTVSGSVMRLGGVIPVSGASIRLKKGTQVVKMTTTNAAGAYTVQDVNPDSYTVEAVKSGLVFSSTPAAVVTNANVTGVNITATR
ncbi:MAG: PKD domain-containing protein, partial [Thermodesulfovibrionales bacterium]